MVMAGSD